MAVHKPVSGYSAAPRGRAVSLGGINPVTPSSAPEITSSEAISETVAAYGHCPKCGSERYTQRKIRS
jgi:hypothetical protein